MLWKVQLGMVRLFSSYKAAVAVQKQIAEFSKDLRAINRVSDGDYLPYRALRNKTQRKTAEGELSRAREESKQLRRGNRLDLFEAEIQACNERESVRASLRPLTAQLTQLEGRLANVTTLLDRGARITSSELNESYAFFRDANREKLETVELYHHKLSRILRSRLEELGKAVMGSIATDFNEATNEANSERYPSGGGKNSRGSSSRSQPRASVTSLTMHATEGQGAKSMCFAIFDAAMLRCAPLSFLTHGSSIINLVGYAPVRELLSAYTQATELLGGAGEPQQVFFSFDATKAYGTRAEELVDVTRVIHHDDDAQALYGFTWNTETSEESN